MIMFALVFGSALCASAQDPIPDNVAPPPVRVITKEERAQLDSASDVKDRMKVALGLMEGRLHKAETLYSESSYTALVDELGSFQALMTNTLSYLNRNDNQRGKVLDTFRKFEIALRGFMPRIETIRRELPDRYEFHVRRILRDVRDARSKAVEPLFADTVVPGNDDN